MDSKRDWKRDGRVAAVTFDCWNTLLWEPEPEAGREVRVGLFEAARKESGVSASGEEARAGLTAAWRHH